MKIFLLLMSIFIIGIEPYKAMAQHLLFAATLDNVVLPLLNSVSRLATQEKQEISQYSALSRPQSDLSSDSPHHPALKQIHTEILFQMSTASILPGYIKPITNEKSIWPTFFSHCSLLWQCLSHG